MNGIGKNNFRIRNGIGSRAISVSNGIGAPDIPVFRATILMPGAGSFTLPLDPLGDHDFYVSKKLGAIAQTVTIWNDANAILNYDSGGVHTMEIFGNKCHGFGFHDGGDKTLFGKILNFGNGVFRFGNSGEYLNGAINCSISDNAGVLDLTGMTDAEAFLGQSGVTTWAQIALSDWSNITTMALFAAQSDFNEPNFENIN